MPPRVNVNALADAIASRRGYRAWFTQAVRQADQSQLMYNRLQNAMTNLQKRFNALNENLVAIYELDPPHEADHQAAIDEVETSFNNTSDALLQTLNAFPQHQPQPAAAQAPQGQAQFKPVQDLKPFTLTFDHTPIELNDWITRLMAYVDASNINTRPIPQQQAFMRQSTDTAVWSVIKQRITDNTPVFDDDPDIDTCLSILRKQYETRYPIIMRRFEFFRYTQQKDQSYSDYYAKLRDYAAAAQVEDMEENDFLIYRIITGVRDSTVRDKLLSIPADAFNLEEVDRVARACEAAHAYSKLKPDTVHKTNHHRHKQKSSNDQKPKTTSNSGQVKRKLKWLKDNKKCFRCAKKAHEDGPCSHANSECRHCGKTGHIAPACSQTAIPSQSRNVSRQPSRHSSPTRQQKQHSDQTNVVRVTNGSSPSPRHNILFIPAVGQKFTYPVLSDSGATRTVISYDIVRKNGLAFEPPNGESLTNASGDEISLRGTISINAKFRDDFVTINALISDALKDEILLSWHDAEALGTLHIARAVSDDFVQHNLRALQAKYPNVLGTSLSQTPMKGPPMKINLRTDIDITPSKVYTSPALPIHFQKEAERSIQEALDAHIIERVPLSEPSDWISRGFFVPKPDGKRLRLVVDYTSLNKCIQRPVHPFTSASDIIRNVNPSSKVFCKLDAVMGYYQIPLDLESTALTTFLLHDGRYRFTRAPMGLSSSSDQWCQRSDIALHGLQGVLKLVDDILVEAPTYDVLFQRIESVFQRCQEFNITLSLSKLEIGDTVPFAGYTISSKGVLPSPTRTSTLKNFPTPENISDLRSFLGLANQLGRFVPDLAQLSEPLRQLLKKDTAWNWLDTHTDAFQDIKNALTGPLLVKPFDPKLSTELVTDASRIGLGYALLQRQANGTINLIECGSRALNEHEKRYAVCELEGLAIAYGLSKSRHYLLGMPHFTIITDHRPLLGLFAKEIPSIQNPRLRRIREKIGEYTFTLEWREGKLHCIADALSRAPFFPQLYGDEDKELCQQVTQTDPRLEKMAHIASTDTEYQAVINALATYVNPQDIPNTHPAEKFKSVWTRLELHPHLNLLMLDNDRIVIPASSKQTILQDLHKSHCGITKTRLQAKLLYYWPNMNADVKNMVQNCTDCQHYLPSKPKSHHTPTMDCEEPMEALGADLFQYSGRHYLLVVDRYSGFPWCFQLKSLITSTILKRLQDIFNIFGWPRKIRTDGGPQFRTEFQTFCSSNDIIAETSSPYNPESNGLAESAVKQVKHLLGKYHGNWDKFTEALFHWRNSPSPYRSQASPNQLFFKRTIRGCLPQLDKSTSDPPIPPHTADTPCFQTGDKVIIQDPLTKNWDKSGEIIESRSSGHSFIIRSDNKLLTRNCKFLHLKKTVRFDL